MTIRELAELCAGLVTEGHGDASVLFDTEAQHYHYHMANVDLAFFETEPTPHLALREDKPHHTCNGSCPT